MRTPLYEAHIALGARMVDFAGWEMPVQYTSIQEEHRATRTQAGLFDVSHMGQLLVEGDGAYEFLQKTLTHDMSRLLEGKWAYSPVCLPTGGTVDDVIVYPKENRYLLCVNASNTDKDFSWFSECAPRGVRVENHSDRYAQIALQGPGARALLEAVDASLILLKPATGYTGERGYELYVTPEHARAVWDKLIEQGAVPCGLGARDTLRMEAALPLYGHELSETISPWEAGLSRFIAFDKGEFTGRQALLEQSQSGQTRRLIGLRTDGRFIPRAGYEVLRGGETVGVVTSGGPALTVGGQVAMALVTPGEGDYAVMIRGKAEPMALTELPFYRRAKPETANK